MRGPHRTAGSHMPERICAFYSKGPHFVRMLKRLRAEYPDETIVAAVPADFPLAVIEGLAVETISLPLPGEGRAWLRNVRILWRLRRARCSHIVVMFDSPRLNLLVRLSGASRRWYFSVDGHLRPLSHPLPSVIAAPIGQRFRGQLNYMRARMGTSRRYRDGE